MHSDSRKLEPGIVSFYMEVVLSLDVGVANRKLNIWDLKSKVSLLWPLISLVNFFCNSYSQESLLGLRLDSIIVSSNANMINTCHITNMINVVCSGAQKTELTPW